MSTELNPQTHLPQQPVRLPVVENSLDRALALTFPASDPIAVIVEATVIEDDAEGDIHGDGGTDVATVGEEAE